MRRRLMIFIAIFATIYFYLLFMWVGPLQLTGAIEWIAAIVLLIPFAAIIWLFTLFFERDELSESAFDRVLQWTAFSSMGLLSFLFVFTVARDVLSFFLTLFKHPEEFLYGADSFWVIAVGGGFFFALGALIARLGLEVTEVPIAIDGLPAALMDFSIVQISDLHIGATIRSGYVKKVVDRANSLNADVLVLTGDIIDGYYAGLRTHAEILQGLRAKYGRFYITGNHEYYWGVEPVIAAFKEFGFSVLLNSNVVIEKDGAHLVIAGVPDYMSTHSGGPAPDPALALAGTPQDAVRILLAHQPSFAKQAADAGYDLQLSGHTHGGQFFPWTYAVRFVHQFARGLGRLGKMWVYVNRGTGYWGPPIRLGAAPEISRIRLKRAVIKD